ncbi:MAG: hypothetical protein RLZZ230_462 [Candidatus Parcubacteria bacterium]|jgi:Fic family protein
MHNLNKRQLEIIDIIKNYTSISFSEIFNNLTGDISERTIKRDLTELVELGYLEISGGGRSTEYTVTTTGRLFLPINVVSYNQIDLDKRSGVCEKYVHSLWEKWPTSLFSTDELQALSESTTIYELRSKDQPVDLHKRELERFVIEMSWKSSQIEGNTYTLLDTELLIKEGVPSSTNSESETQMILNHKSAFDFTLVNKDHFKNSLSFGLIETLHQHLMKSLLHDQGLRTGVVGITGSRYQPLDNQHQIREALEKIIIVINKCEDVFSKALTALVGISYIQPFTDGNKRTARLLANGILLSHGYAPLSYRDVDERTYRASLLVFYEQLSLVPMKDLFTAQYHFSANQYAGVA